MRVRAFQWLTTSVVVAAGGVLASCAPVAPTDDGQARAALSAELAGRTAGAPLQCITDYSDTQMRAYGDDILFRVGNDLYVNHTDGGCENAGSSGYTFVLNRFGGAGNLCRNTSVKVVDSSSGMFAGNCSLGDFVPYK